MSDFLATSTTPAPSVRLRGVTHRYSGRSAPPALNDLSCDLYSGELTAVLGRSGSGKSTLFNLVGGIDRATAGDVAVNGTSLHTLSERELTMWRGTTVGLVFQFFQLLPTLTVQENLLAACELVHGRITPNDVARTQSLLDRVGVADQAHKFPTNLSGGQQQRVAIARALVNEPPVLLADEPTGNLDSATAREVGQLFVELARAGRTVVVVTHDLSLAALADRRITLSDGRVLPEATR
jgi:putative ABC transport system ATP-binding protein